jgi:hypothetical protein
VRIDPADAGSHEPVRLHECKHLVVLGDGSFRQPREQQEDLLPPREAATRELPDDERVAKNFGRFEPG